MAKNSDSEFQWFEADLSDILYLVRKHIRLLLLAPPLGFALALAVSFMMRPVFSTEALVYLRPNFDKDMQIEQTLSKLEDDDSLRSMERSMTSDTVILRMVDRLDLRSDEDFLGKGALDEGALTDAKLLKLVRDRYQTELVPTTRLVELKVDDYSAQRVTLIANTLIDEFLTLLGNDRSTKEAELRTALTAQAELSLKQTLEVETKLEAFRARHPELLVEQDSEIFHERLLQQGAALNEANSEMARLAGTVATLDSVDPEKDPYRVFQVMSNRNNEYLANLLSMLAASKAEMAAVKQRATERNPDYQAAASRLEQVEATVRDYAVEMKNGVESEFRAASEKAIKLNDTLVGLQGEFVGFKSTSAEFRGIKGEIDRHWNTFMKLQQALMDLDLEPETTPTFVTVVSEPVVPDKKSKPFRLLWVAAGTILGGLFATGMIFVRNRRGLPFTSAEQASDRFDVPTIAALKIPLNGSALERMAEVERSPQLRNILIAQRNSDLVHITSLNQNSTTQLLPELIARTCAKQGIETLWISFAYLSKGPASIKPMGIANLSKLDMVADDLLDGNLFESGFSQLREKYGRIIVDTTQLSETEARLAVAQEIPSTVLLVDGSEVPRTEYDRFMSQCGALPHNKTALVYLTSTNQLPASAPPLADHHGFGNRPSMAEEPKIAVNA